MGSESTPNLSSPPAGVPPGRADAPSRLDWLLFGPKGLRPVWRIISFIALVYGFSLVADLIGPVRHAFARVVSDPQVGPVPVIVIELARAIEVLAAAAIMALLEKRPFAEYGLPGGLASAKRFLQGLPLGFVMLSVLLAAIGALRGFSIHGFSVGGAEALKYALLWGIAFALVGLYEDFLFRGYLQAALGDGIGFWPAAIILALVFGGIHLGNSGEAIFGVVMAALFGLVDAFALRRTGSLWLPIGMHMSWDWSETFFYGTPDSGVTATGHLLNSSFHGAKWLTGGTVGPEGSWLVLPTLLLWVLAIHLLFPAKPASASA